jgi:hypothetical protein
MTTSTYYLGTQYLGDRDEEEESPPYEMTSGKRKPKWIQETLKEAHESVGNPKRDVR